MGGFTRIRGYLIRPSTLCIILEGRGCPDGSKFDMGTSRILLQRLVGCRCWRRSLIIYKHVLATMTANAAHREMPMAMFKCECSRRVCRDGPGQGQYTSTVLQPLYEKTLPTATPILFGNFSASTDTGSARQKVPNKKNEKLKRGVHPSTSGRSTSLIFVALGYFCPPPPRRRVGILLSSPPPAFR